MTTTTSIQDLNRDLARRINAEAKEQPPITVR